VAKNRPGTTCFNGFFNLVAFMNLTVIKKDAITALQGRSQHFFDKVNHEFTLNRAFDAQRSTPPCQAHGANGGIVPLRITGNYLWYSFSLSGARI